jgi:hypothetical protein
VTTRRCTATCADGSPCKAWAVHGTSPPRCAAHGGTLARIGAPPGNRNALKHGYYARTAPGGPLQSLPPEDWTIETIILDLCTKQTRLSHYIDEHSADMSPDELARFLRLHGMNASRLGRLLRDKHALLGHADDAMNEIIRQTLNELNKEWGTDL